MTRGGLTPAPLCDIMRLKFVMDCEHAGKSYQRGDEAELDDASAFELLNDGVAERYTETPAPDPQPSEPETERPAFTGRLPKSGKAKKK